MAEVTNGAGSGEHKAHRRVILLWGEDERLAPRCRELSPDIDVITRAQVDADPTLLQTMEVAFGRLPAQRCEQAPLLRWLQVSGAGVEVHLTPAVRDSPLIMTNASGIHAEPITEHMFGLLLAHQHRLFQSWDAQKKAHWDGSVSHGSLPILPGKTLGLLGVGRIGACSARVGKAFGMTTIGLRRHSQPHPDLDRTYSTTQLLGFLAECDVIMNTLPLTTATRGLIGAREMEAMKPGVILINTGRGATVQTDALVAGLRAGRPGAALLDVTDPEPLPDGHPLWTLPNVVITPHYSGSHDGYGERAGAIFLDNLKRYLNRQPLKNVVDKQEGY